MTADVPGAVAPVRSTPPLGRWLARALARLGWRQIALAALCSILFATFGPNGGAFLFPGPRLSDPFADLLSGRWLFTIMPVIIAAMVADEAYRDGVPPVIAYGSALLLGALVASGLDKVMGLAVAGRVPGWGSRGGSLSFNGFRFKSMLLLGGVCTSVYAYWRTTQRALERFQAAEAERVRERQQLLATRLMALQARVEPQFLFDALTRIGAMHERDPEAADATLADLISLLRAMLPTGTAAISTVVREFALAEAWLRVLRRLGVALDVEIAASPIAATAGIGAMIVLPLLQEMQSDPPATRHAWRLSAELVPATSPSAAAPLAAEMAPRTPRLVLRLAPLVSLPQHASEAAATPGLTRLLQRLAELHGSDANLSVVMLGEQARAFEVNLPMILETPLR